jgi:hypothetical protein
VIERELRHGHPIPRTAADRAAIARECPLRVDERSHHAA